MNDERNMYFDIFGIGLFLTAVFENYCKWIMISTFGIVLGIKGYEIVMSEYNRKKAEEYNKKCLARGEDGTQLRRKSCKKVRG